MIKPLDVLSAAEVTAAVGVPAAVDATADNVAYGVLGQRYSYDLKGSSIHALLEIHQDGIRTAPGTAAQDFFAEKQRSAKEIAPATIGDDAFTHGQGQLHLLYRGYYVVAAFEGDAYGEKAVTIATNLRIGATVLANLKTKIG